MAPVREEKCGYVPSVCEHLVQLLRRAGAPPHLCPQCEDRKTARRSSCRKFGRKHTRGGTSGNFIFPPPRARNLLIAEIGLSRLDGSQKKDSPHPSPYSARDRPNCRQLPSVVPCFDSVFHAVPADPNRWPGVKHVKYRFLLRRLDGGESERERTGFSLDEPAGSSQRTSHGRRGTTADSLRRP